ncbi:hypothetical protein BJX66DRAFT_83571 [Aspergillus keveii]|uniref:Uncharacterized protein n=1 Tax=Aspergillus keveii TaxID=714993 RepID=A0ABR4FNT1_9EURO
MATALLWLDEQANGRENVSTWLGCAAASKEDGQCCEHYTVLETEKEEWDKTDYHHLRLGQSECWYRLLDSRRMAYSPLMHMEFSTIRPYGFMLWEATRMTALGFHPKGSPMPWWFALSSIFTDDDWEGIRTAACPAISHHVKHSVCSNKSNLNSPVLPVRRHWP